MQVQFTFLSQAMTEKQVSFGPSIGFSSRRKSRWLLNNLFSDIQIRQGVVSIVWEYMQRSDKGIATLNPRSSHTPLWLCGLAVVMFLLLLLTIWWPWGDKPVPVPPSTNRPSAMNLSNMPARKVLYPTLAALHRRHAESAAEAQQIVAGKLKAFALSRRKLAHALAQRHGVPVPDNVEKFFDAVEAGNWDEIKARYHEINGGDGSVSTHNRSPDIQPLWPAIADAFGAAEQVHLWPPQQLIDYGNSIMNSLSPGEVYVGGTDNGRWVPELMNADSGDASHIILTQNALVDTGYIEYVNLQYGDQLTTLTGADADKAMQNYLADYQQRLAHDQQFPDEPPQVRPGESAGISIGSNGQPQVTGPNAQVSVMAINEGLLNILMSENPQLSFALQESYPLKSTYADALPVGPIMQLGASGGQNTFTADTAAQTIDYWNTTTQQLLSDPDAADSTTVQKAYAKDETSAANLLAAHGYNAEAAQIYGTALQLFPSAPETASDYVNLLLGQNQVQQAIAVAQAAAQADPNNQQLQNLLQRAKSTVAH
jgi:hypothetical protein